jgi:hypothetical protein
MSGAVTELEVRLLHTIGAFAARRARDLSQKGEQP